MRILVYPHTMEIGRCQLNTVETADALVIASDGPAQGDVEKAAEAANARSSGKVVVRFSLEHVAAMHDQIYLAAREAPPLPRALLALGSARSASGLVRYRVHRKFQKLRGTAPIDESNAISAILRQELRGERPLRGVRCEPHSAR